MATSRQLTQNLLFPRQLLISGGKGTAEEKIAALEAAGIEVAQSPADMGAAMKRAIDRA